MQVEGQALGVELGGALEHDAELVAADPRGQPAAAELLEHAADRAQRGVPGGMAGGVVELLEAVHVAEQEREAGAAGAPERRVEALLEGAAVGQPRQRVAIGGLDEAGEELGAAERQRELGADRLHELDVDRRDARGVGRVGDVHLAPRLTLVDDRGRRAGGLAEVAQELALGGVGVRVVERRQVRTRRA